MDVVCVGDCGIDLYLPSGETRVGGITANVARHARAEFEPGDNIHIVSCVGDDAAATQVLDNLRGTGIGCCISNLEGPTPVQSIEIEGDGERRFTRYEAGVLADFRFSDEQTALIAQADLVVAPVYLQIAGLFETLMSIPFSGCVAIDFADFLEHPDFGLMHRYIEGIDIGIFGLTTDDSRAINEIGRLAARHDKLFVVTLGAAGSLAFSGSDRFECAAVSVPGVVDTTGAGDAYAAAFLADYCHGQDIPTAMQRGAALAAKVISRIGSHQADQRGSSD